MGPLLFNIYINDLSEKLKCYFLLFADDLKIFVKVKSFSDIIKLQNDIDALYEWSVLNKLQLNIQKCNTIIYSNRMSHQRPLYFMNGSYLRELSEIKDLGVTFDSKLKFDRHIDQIVKKSYSMLGFIMRTTSNFNNHSCLQFLYNSLVRSRLEYNSFIWNPYQLTYKLKIERVQRKYTRLLQFRLHQNPIPYNDRLIFFNMMELEKRREYFDSCMLHKVVHDHNSVTHSRPIFRVNHYSNRINATFNPKTSSTDYGLHRNPITRSQLLFNRKFNHINILDVNSDNCKRNIMVSLAG